MNIKFKNIRTHNLKGFDFTLKPNSINCIVGVSGSGKSSLAFDTIHAVCEHEYKRMIGDDFNMYEYKLDSYSNILISVPINQLNYNTNPRSTIATYYGIDKVFKYLFAAQNNVPIELFSFNTRESCCKKCLGLGYMYIPDESKIIDYNLTVDEVPFYPWRNSMKNFYKQILQKVAIENNIPLNVPFIELHPSFQNLLLSGESNEKYKINYIQNNKKRVKTSKYKGVLIEVKNYIDKKDEKVKLYSKKVICEACDGTRFSSKILKYKVNGKSIGDIYLMQLTDLHKWIRSVDVADNNLKNRIKEVEVFIENLIEMKLEYLTLNRSISSLSGGEFQRLRISQIINSKLKNLLFVLDEPLSSLHADEKDTIIEKMKILKKNNTILIVEHDANFLKHCDNIIALGDGGGVNGGNLIPVKKYIDMQSIKTNIPKINLNKTIEIFSNEKINNINSLQIKIPLGTCIGIGGLSGSGKTTFVRDILPKKIKEYVYISQKPIKGNAYSIVASYINVFDKIKKLFSNENNLSKSLFSFYYNSEGACKNCSGTGKIKISDYENSELSYVCPKCQGSRYNEKVLKYKYFNYNINEILNLDIESAKNFFYDKDESIYENLKIACEIGLGYLKLNQPISTLSGGEGQRMKLLKNISFRNSNITIALDEPFQGLSSREIYDIMNLLYKFVKLENTILIVEHNILALKLCTYIIEFGTGSGTYGGKVIYSGRIDEINKCKKSRLKNYLNLK